MQRELARIKATQKAWEFRHRGRPTQRPKPLFFKDWLQPGIEHYKKQGFSFEFVNSSVMIIIGPDSSSFQRSCSDFRDEYETEYLSKF
jgi:hypothetical protein